MSSHPYAICGYTPMVPIIKKLAFSLRRTIERSGVPVPVLFDNTGFLFHKNAIIELIPSLQFQLSVNWTASTTIAKLEDLICRHVKKWLHLPRNATRIILHHPETLNITPLSHSKTK